MRVNSIKTVIAAIGLGMSLTAFGQSVNQNYILKRTYKDNGAYFDDIQYYDGLGRPMETVQKQFTPGSKDLVSRIEYDGFGREYKQWLPAPDTTKSDGSYNGSSPSYYGDNNPYSEIVYEPSPLNRIKDRYGPGAAWRTGSHKVTTEYMTNNSGINALKCPNYYANDAYSFTKTTDYTTGQLYVTQMTDEDGNVSYEFKDKSGKVLLQRRMSGSDKYDTYYIYDDFGNLQFILPPLALLALTANQTYNYWAYYNNTYLPDLVYSFNYDDRRRRHTEVIAGAGVEASVFDTADRLVMHQTDAIQIPNGTSGRGWLFYKYDALGRVVLSGIYHGDDNSVRDDNERVFDMRNIYKTILSKESPSNNAGDFYYTWNSFPAKAESEVTRVYFYDNYTCAADNAGNSGSLVYQAKANYGVQYSSAQGLLTGTWDQLSDSSGWIKTTYYYDAWGNLVQKRSTNNKSGYDYECYAYNHNNQMTKKYVEHTALGQAAITEEYIYEYDARLRLTKVNYKFSGNKDKIGIDIAEYKYNDLGRMKEKKTGGGQETAAFAYNLRGRQTEQVGQRFSEYLYYESIPSTLPNYSKFSREGYYGGNVSALVWKAEPNPATVRGYEFKYDSLGRLNNAVYGEGVGLTGGLLKYDESFTYDKHGNIVTLKRYGIKDNNTFGLIDNLTVTEYKGNQIRKISDAAGNQNSSDVMEFKKTYMGLAAEYIYWGGRLSSDYNRNICMIKYNYLNLPKSVQFRRGDRIEYVYDAAGVKRQTTHKESNLDLNYDYWSLNEPAASDFNASKTVTTQYFGNKVYVNNQLKYILTEEGYIEKATGSNTYTAHYYLNDRLGSHRIVMDASGAVKQVNNFYPSGTSMAEREGGTISKILSVQPYKFGGKELDRTNSMDFYDFEARVYNPTLMRFTRPDPMAEKYSGTSPYAYCGNNPVNRVDPTGTDWYWNNGTRQFNPELNEYNQAEILKKGQTYIGATDAVKNKNGEVIEDYRKDGSIMFSNESSGYARIWNNSQLTGNEEFGVITDNGVLVLPSYKNDNSEATPENYGYSWQNGDIIDPVSKKTQSTLGTIHTHPDPKGGDATASIFDIQYFSSKTPNKVFIVMGYDGNLRTYRAYGQSKYDGIILPPIGGIKPTIQGLMNGYQMKALLKNNKK